MTDISIMLKLLNQLGCLSVKVQFSIKAVSISIFNLKKAQGKETNYVVLPQKA